MQLEKRWFTLQLVDRGVRQRAEFGAVHSLDEGANGSNAVEYVAMEDLPFSGLLEARLTDTCLCRFEI